MQLRCTAYIMSIAVAIVAATPLNAQSASRPRSAALWSDSAAVQSAPLPDGEALSRHQVALQTAVPLGASPLRPARTTWSTRRASLTAYDNASAAAAVLEGDDARALQDGSGWSSLRIAKWTTAGLAAAAAVYGVANNRQADEEYEQLEQLCVEQPARCTDRLPDGAYADAEMEAQYQNVRALDRRARTALIAGQIGIAAGVLLFVLDLRNNDGPGNIPYDPDRLDIMPARDGGMSLRVNMPLPGH